MSLKLVIAPTEEPVSLEELKAHLVTTSDDQNDDLAEKLAAAIAHVSNELRRCLVTTTYDLLLERWPCREYLDIPLGNIQSVTHIKYTDSAGTVTTVDADTYKVTRTYTPADAEADPPVIGDGVLDAGIGRVCLAYGQYWPTATLDTGEPVVIRFTCGWDGAANVPLPIKQAILMLAAHWFRNRDAVVIGNAASSVSSEVALGVQRLCSMYEDGRF